MTMMTTFERKAAPSGDDLNHCEAFNAAFYDLGLNWYWDLSTYRALEPDAPGMQQRLRGYLESEHAHMLKAYKPEFLIDAIVQTKERCLSTREECGHTGHLGDRWAGMHAQVGV
ncbi:MAG: hypothetical protein JWR21_2752 [Herminiimonas sp.]|nr:hypothetical protein [Herminiimonas sp.]